jgi:ferrous iron transport protein B
VNIVLVGSPNVGKSLLFYHLTGKYATVSNYPGTSVEITRGKMKGTNATLTDTPGMYSFLAITEEERVAKKMLLEKPEIVVHVIDAKNIERMLPFTLQLIDAHFNTILVLNAIDEAERLGIQINVELLREKLGIPVIATIATQKKGIRELKEAIISFKGEKRKLLKFNSWIGSYLTEIKSCLKLYYPFSKEFLSLLLLMGDGDAFKIVRNEEKYEEIVKSVEKARNLCSRSLSYEIAMQIQKISNNILEDVVEQKTLEKGSFREKMSELSLHPSFAVPMAAAALLLLYLFAGILGAQIIAGVLENVFEEYINTPLNEFLNNYVPYYWIRELIGGEFGIITLGLRYGFAIILPIVTSFFFIFSIIEDSGYLPRLAMLLDRFFKSIDLSGKAVIPLVLGLGCGTMATIVTRVLETRKERIIATFMIAIGIPCSAQLGVMMAIAPDFKAFLMWFLIVASIMVVVGFLASKFFPGSPLPFFIEVPPLRMPNIGNVVTKTLTRLEWYFKEVLPIFILASIFIWIGRIMGLFDVAVSVLAFPSVLIGLPKEAAIIFLFGFFRRDYGAAGLYDLASKGILSYSQVIIAMVTLTLFVPCIAQFLVMIRERGMRLAMLIFVTAVVVAFGVGYIIHVILM